MPSVFVGTRLKAGKICEGAVATEVVADVAEGVDEEQEIDEGKVTEGGAGGG
jgi:hypothetical protein